MTVRILKALDDLARENMGLRNERNGLMRANCALAHTIDGLRDKLGLTHYNFTNRYDEVSGVVLDGH